MNTTLTMDASGRVVIPREVRRRLGLEGPAQFSITLMGDCIELKPSTEARSPLKRKGGILVYTGPVPKDWSAAKAVDELRRERLDRLAE